MNPIQKTSTNFTYNDAKDTQPAKKPLTVEERNKLKEDFKKLAILEIQINSLKEQKKNS